MSRVVKEESRTGRNGELGFLLIGLVVAVFLIALFLTVAAPTVARSLERDKEVESEHRAQQYVRAIHNYYLKFGSYPTSLDQLLSQNNIHFLRQEYKDPLTGGDYRLIHFGEAKTQVKGFFGEPLDGMTGSSGALGAGSSSMGGSSIGGPLATSSSMGSASGAGGSSFGSGGFSLGGSIGSGTGSGGSGTGSAAGGTSATQIQGSKGMIVGVGSKASGHGLVEWNGSANIEDWEFLYDHRTWLMRQRVSITGGAMGGAPGSSSMNSVSAGSSTLGGGPASPGSSGSGSGALAPGNSSSMGSGSGANSSSTDGPQNPGGTATPQP